MAKVTILGSSNAVPDEDHGYAHFLVEHGSRTILVDCAGDVVVRLQKIGVEPDRLTDLVITHFHPDHAAGVPLLLMDHWLMGKTTPLTIHGLGDALDRVKTMMDLYRWETWKGIYPVLFNTVEEKALTTVLQTDTIEILAAPARHMIPSIGVRFNFLDIQKSLAYSADTEPCDGIKQLAEDADMLIHEAAGEFPFHTSPWQAAEVAALANVGTLFLIHYGERGAELEKIIKEAEGIAGCPVLAAEDFMEIQLN